jgi:hypothetical protein
MPDQAPQTLGARAKSSSVHSGLSETSRKSSAENRLFFEAICLTSLDEIKDDLSTTHANHLIGRFAFPMLPNTSPEVWLFDKDRKHSHQQQQSQ